MQENVPEDIYRRHDNCTCTVTYYNGKERQNIWTKKSWQATDEESERRRELGKAQPTKLSREEAKAKEREIIEKNPLTFGRKSGIIKTRGLSAKIGGDGFIEEHEEPKLIRIIDPTDKTAIRKELIEFEKTVVSEPIEHGCVVTKDGEVYHCFGTKDRVFVDSDLGDKLNGAYVSHNHPMSETEFSFSSDDIRMFYSTNMNELVGFDEKYEYRLSRTDLTIDKEPENWDMSENVQHTRIILSIQDDYNSEFGYTRKERGK